MRKIRKAVTLYTTGVCPSIANGLEQYGLSPTELKQFRDTAAVCSGVSLAHVTAIENGVGQQHNPSIHSKHVSAFSPGGSAFGMRAGNCINLFGRHGSASTPHSDSPGVDGGLFEAPCPV